MAVAVADNEVRIRHEFRGGNRAILACRDREVLLEGPAGTGKTRAMLTKVHLCMLKYPGARAFITRAVHQDLKASALQTFDDEVVSKYDFVEYYGGSAREPAQYRYPNGSEIFIGGMDRSSKAKSTQFDIIFVNEGTEIDEDTWETLMARNRHGVMPYQQLLADCNPDRPTHWLNQRANAGKTTRHGSRHEDNPAFHDGADWTPRGREYIAVLEQLTGARYLRLRKGVWAMAEGMVYDTYDPNIHVIDRFPIPDDWARYLVVDFGYTNPFVCQWWAVDGDGRAYMYREIYMTQRLVEDHARDIKRLHGEEPPPVDVVCDHDAEGRETLQRYLGWSTRAAVKVVREGIQEVQARLRPAGDGKARLFYFRDALVEKDQRLLEKKKPVRTVEEYEGYVWDEGSKRLQGEDPVKQDDHGMDATRYFVMRLARGGVTFV